MSQSKQPRHYWEDVNVFVRNYIQTHGRRPDRDLLVR